MGATRYAAVLASTASTTAALLIALRARWRTARRQTGLERAQSTEARGQIRLDAAREQELAAPAEARLYPEAGERERQKDEQLAAIAHDLKGPISVIRASVQLMRRRQAPATPEAGAAAAAAPIVPGTATPEPCERFVAMIEQSTARATALVDELAAVAARGRGAPSLECRRTDLVALARRVASQQEATTERHAINVRTDSPALVGVWDEARLERVLGNLVGNAVKYSPDGGEVEVALTRERDPHGEWSVVRVRDAGIGIPERDMGRVFERLYRASNARERSPSAGIGLASARQIVEQHGGTISVLSAPGRGTTFTVRLPPGEHEAR